MRPIVSTRPLAAGLALVLGCTPAPPPAPSADEGEPPAPPAAQEQNEFQASHHAVVEGVVTGRGGQPLDSVTVVAWRLADGGWMLAQTRTVSNAAGRFRVPVQATVGPRPDTVAARVVVRGFGYASRYPRGPQGAVALDSTTVRVTLVPLAQSPPSAQARLTLPLP